MKSRTPEADAGLILREGKVHEIKGLLAIVNTGIYAIPRKADLVAVSVAKLVW